MFPPPHHLYPTPTIHPPLLYTMSAAKILDKNRRRFRFLHEYLFNTYADDWHYAMECAVDAQEGNDKRKVRQALDLIDDIIRDGPMYIKQNPTEIVALDSSIEAFAVSVRDALEGILDELEEGEAFAKKLLDKEHPVHVVADAFRKMGHPVINKLRNKMKAELEEDPISDSEDEEYSEYSDEESESEPEPEPAKKSKKETKRKPAPKATSSEKEKDAKGEAQTKKKVHKKSSKSVEPPKKKPKVKKPAKEEQTESSDSEYSEISSIDGDSEISWIE
jgi:hypothetical protein